MRGHRILFLLVALALVTVAAILAASGQGEYLVSAIILVLLGACLIMTPFVWRYARPPSSGSHRRTRGHS